MHVNFLQYYTKLHSTKQVRLSLQQSDSLTCARCVLLRRCLQAVPGVTEHKLDVGPQQRQHKWECNYSCAPADELALLSVLLCITAASTV
jgi:hypothetical protein